MYCTQCGQQNQDTANFCYHCGQAITSQKPVAASPTEITNNRPVEEMTSDPVETQSRKSEPNNYAKFLPALLIIPVLRFCTKNKANINGDALLGILLGVSIAIGLSFLYGLLAKNILQAIYAKRPSDHKINNSRPYYGIKGWLFWFSTSKALSVFSIFIILNPSSFEQYYASIGIPDVRYTILDQAILLFDLFFSMRLAYLLFNHDSRAVGLSLLYAIVIYPLQILSAFISPVISGTDLDGIELIMPLVFLSMTVLFFTVSKRVKDNFQASIRFAGVVPYIQHLDSNLEPIRREDISQIFQALSKAKKS